MPLKFQIRNQTLDPDRWEAVDKSAQWATLKAGIAEKAERVVEAVQEMYAVVKAEVNEELTLADVWGPHHTIRQDGTLVLSRGGMIAAAETLAGARAYPDLTAEQKRQAARHLLRHYRQEEVNLQPPQQLLDLAGTGEMAYLEARVTGEMRPADIPLAPGVNLLALKANDPDPMEVVVEIPAGPSKRGWEYGKIVIRQLANQLPVAGFLGHQKAENFDTEFPTPVTHWVGATYRDGSTFARGVIDKAAVDLKRWIRANVINQVSIFGHMATEVRDGKTHVTSIELLSIDWTPLDRAGMKTRVVAVGEQALIEKSEGGKGMTLTEMLGELRKLGVKPGQVVGEMGWDVKTLAKELGWEFDKVAGEISAERWTQLQEAVKVLGEISQVFGLGKDMKVSELVPVVKLAKEAQEKAATAGHDVLVDKIIGEMVQAESVRPLVKRMLRVDPAADEAAIKTVVGELLKAEDVKKVLAGVFKEDPIAPKDGQRSPGGTSNTIKRVSI